MNHFTPFVHVFQQQKGRESRSVEPTHAGVSAHQSAEINRLLTAAVINQEFQRLLLSDPQSALESGFNNETFHFCPAVTERILSIRATTLQEFAQQIVQGPSVSSPRNWPRATESESRERASFPALRFELQSA